MSPQCSTKRSVALGSFPAFSVLSVITEISEIEERKSSAQAIRENLSELQRVMLWLPDQLPFTGNGHGSITRPSGASTAQAARLPAGLHAASASRRPSRR